MGGRPVTALSLVVFPAKGDIEDLEAILKGGAEKIHEADCVILGGHSISEDEVKFGYAVTGLIDPKRILTNAGAKPGDVLIFTKRIGTGVISTALKRRFCETNSRGSFDRANADPKSGDLRSYASRSMFTAART